MIDIKTKYTQFLTTPLQPLQIHASGLSSFAFFSLKNKNKFGVHILRRLMLTQHERFQNNSLNTKGSFSAKHHFLTRPLWALLENTWNKPLSLLFCLYNEL